MSRLAYIYYQFVDKNVGGQFTSAPSPFPPVTGLQNMKLLFDTSAPGISSGHTTFDALPVHITALLLSYLEEPRSMHAFMSTCKVDQFPMTVCACAHAASWS